MHQDLKLHLMKFVTHAATFSIWFAGVAGAQGLPGPHGYTDHPAHKTKPV